MSNTIRRAICEKISQAACLRKDVYYDLELPARRPTNSTRAVFHWTDYNLPADSLLQLIPSLQFDKTIVEAVRLIPAAGKVPAKLEFQVNPQTFVEHVILQNTAQLNVPRTHGHVVLDFSSPNIAKPFHVGHLRSTIIGNVLANLHEHLGYGVTRLNYLGDWGTQFGMLQVGVKMLDITETQMRLEPIETLYRAYVTANMAAKTDPTIAEQARQLFKQLELDADPTIAQQWQQYRKYTVADLAKVYARLGVHFDQYDWESQYSQQQIAAILQQLQSQELLLDEVDGRKVVQVNGRRIPIVKSDGSTLYLARDIAALMDRYERFRFERMLYVVENGQADHFNACFQTTAALCKDIPVEGLEHVKFGRIHGMSTRSGNAVFLRDVLDEACDIMLEKQLKSPTTKVKLSCAENNGKKVADILGVSAVIVNDLKQRRQRDYNFDWQKALQVNGDTGIKLQYTHCRLHSLLENVAELGEQPCQPLAKEMQEPEAQDLIYEIARFEQCIWQAKQQLEACILVNYLFTLCNVTSRALKHLNVKHESCRRKQQQRIMLFTAAKRTLNAGMRLLGLQPLDKM